ncbi:MAG: leucine-rich repeat domain-containing protein [Clostridia bacterium]|nr:leucine-rich repeat domain-containing protein [Clostridia bacterium]
MKKLKAILSFVFALGIMCLGFSFASNNYSNVNAFAYSSQIVLEENAVFNMAGGTISNSVGNNGGAIYVGEGATFTMTGGKIKNCSATNGGAVYVANGGTFNFDGGTIENCVADLGGAVYVESGGTFNYENNADGFSGCGEDQDLHIYAEDGAIVIGPGTNINIYVDDATTPAKTMKKTGDTYTIYEEEMPLDYESCCGYFLDSELRTTIKNNTIDLSNGDVNLYTRTVDPSLFTFTTDGADGYKITKNSAVSYSGTEFNLVMPREYDGKTVTTIADFAFKGKFNSCGSVNITFSSEITEVPIACFDTDLGDYNCNIKSINIHNNITSIGNSAFSYCSGLTGGLTIPNNLTSIGNSAFAGCSGLTGGLTIPNNLTSIGNSAFAGCSGLTGGLTIPNNLTSIGSYAFYNCMGMTGTLSISNNVTNIKEYTFALCSGFTGNLVIPDGVMSIGDYAFSSCSGLTGSLTIPDSVTSIGYLSFSDCEGLTSLIIDDSVVSIGEGSFHNCIGLTRVIIGNSVTSIERRAFNNCTGLESIYIPNTVETIVADNPYMAPFSYCSSELVIYTDVANAESVPNGRGQCWYFYSSSSGGILTVNYGYTLEQYKSAVGLTFAPNSEKISGVEIETLGNGNSYQIDTSYLQNVILEEKEYVALPKKQTKIA